MNISNHVCRSKKSAVGELYYELFTFSNYRVNELSCFFG